MIQIDIEKPNRCGECPFSVDYDCIIQKRITHEYYDGLDEQYSHCPIIEPEKICVAKITLTDEQIMEAVEKAKNGILSIIESGPQWIPCSERLPEDGTWNIFTEGKTISVERYKVDMPDHFFPGGRRFQFEDATAWMPLPEPWRGEEHGET